MLSTESNLVTGTSSLTSLSPTDVLQVNYTGAAADTCILNNALVTLDWPLTARPVRAR